MKKYKKILKLNETELRKIIKENIDKTLGFKCVWVVYVRDSASRWYSTNQPFQCARGFFKYEVLYYMKKHKAFNKLTMEELVKHYKRGKVEMWIADFGKFFQSGEYIIMLDRLHVKKAIELGVLPPLDILPPGQRLGGESGLVRWDITDDNSINEKQSIKLNESQLRKMIKKSLNEYIGGIRPGALNQELTNKFLESIKDVKIAEAVKKSIKKVLNEGQEEIQNRAVEALSSIGIEVVNKTPYEILKEFKEMYGLDCHVHPDRDGEMCYWWITDKTGEVLVEGDDTPYGNSSGRFICEMILEMCKLILKK